MITPYGTEIANCEWYGATEGALRSLLSNSSVQETFYSIIPIWVTVIMQIISRNNITMSQPIIDEARRLAAIFLNAQGQTHNAEMVEAGKADDFPEVQAIIMTLTRQSDRMTRYEQALHCYASEDFWDDIGGGALAIHDRGEIARNVLDGRTPFRDVC